MPSIYTIAELLELEPPSWLIDQTLPEQGLIALYGNPGDGKSFLALDMALSVAAGLPWQGFATRKTYTVYISAEGGRGISKRVGAWLTHHQIQPRDYADVLSRFVVSAIRIHPESTDLDDVLSQTIAHPDYVDALDDVLDPDEARPPLFLVVDTLARCFEGNENQQEDMNNFIVPLDAIREQYSATVLVVHHSKKKEADERGSNVFRADCDTMMFVEKAETIITLSCTKQKDYDPFEDRQYDLVVVPEWNSCALDSVDARLAREQAEFRAAYHEYLLVHPSASERELATALGTSKTTIHRLIQQIRSERSR